MIQGRLERLLSDGFVEGFAWDTAVPRRALQVEARTADGQTVGAGLAHLYRDDLAEAGLGLGWCGVRLRLAIPVAIFQHERLALYERSGGELLDESDRLPLVEGGFATPNVSVVGGYDPFSCQAISALRACGELFDRYVRTHGMRAFARAAYLYVLDRRADPETLALNLALLERGMLTPYGLLEMLADSAEFRAEPRRLAGPKTLEFPFTEPAHAG